MHRECHVNEFFHIEEIIVLCLQKATKKTDKPRLEDKDDLDVTELSNEELLDQLVRYGVNPGPIVGKGFICLFFVLF